MIDDIVSAALTWAWMVVGTCAIVAAMFGWDRSAAPAGAATVPSHVIVPAHVVVTGHRSTTALAQRDATGAVHLTAQ